MYANNPFINKQLRLSRGVSGALCTGQADTDREGTLSMACNAQLPGSLP